MQTEYHRLVYVYVKPDLREKIIELKKEKTYDQFLRDLILENKKELGVIHPHHNSDRNTKSTKNKGDSNVS